MPEVFTGS